MKQTRPYDDPRWKPLRLEVLARDDWRCQIKGPRCKVAATHVDHVRDWRDGGAWFDPANLRAACASCNIAKRNQNIAALARQARGLEQSTPAASVDRPRSTAPRWWTFMGSPAGGSWEPISARFADDDCIFAVEQPARGATPRTP